MFDDDNNIIFGDDDDLDEDKDYMTFTRLAVAASIAVVKLRRKSRKTCFVRTRLEWHLHVEQLHEEGPQSFARLYRMNYSSFMKLLDVLRPALLTNEKMSRVRTPFGPITPQIALHCTLRWLAGGSYLDIRLFAGLSVASFCRTRPLRYGPLAILSVPLSGLWEWRSFVLHSKLLLYLTAVRDEVTVAIQDLSNILPRITVLNQKLYLHITLFGQDSFNTEPM